ncbi:MAG: 1-acyl-sn-glycerol-3-phosphate acyltransferase [Acidobacteria bacterium]|nr:1-acyl-sn-glycerol-3-phosphate acyltransferase [Acidobacteriota bacterium]MCA1609991.1 1-acyl-sn-glycerol-3-phosphate acyltransferase [Acidobacteriota bacterium]
MLVAASVGCLTLARLTGRASFFHRLWAVIISRICHRDLEITGAKRDPSAQLIVANHVSYLDVIPMAYIYPDVRPVVMSRIRSWFLIGWFAPGGAILVNDQLPESRRQAREEMRKVWKSGGVVFLFPEGRAAHGAPPSVSWRERRRSRFSSRSIAAGPFRLGPFEEAVASGVTTQGVRISYPPELVAALNGRWFEEKFFWILCQNFKIRAHVFPSEPPASDAETLRRTWEERVRSRPA